MSKLKRALDQAKQARESGNGPPPQEANEPVVDVSAAPEDLLKKALEKSRQQTESGTENLGVESVRDHSVPEPPSRSVAEPETASMPRKTPVIPTSRHLLEKNKLVSLFHQGEAADQIKLLRTQVFEKLKATGGNSLLITSPRDGEGKTLLAVNLAVSIAQEVNRTTLLVDTDLRRPSVHRFFGLTARKGLADYLLGESDLSSLLINPGIDKLTILPVGPRSLPNSTELLGAPRMEALVKEMKGRYPDRFLIFDSSPLLCCPDPVVFSRFIDGVVLVVQAERTKRRDLERSLELLERRPLLGLVMNKVQRTSGY